MTTSQRNEQIRSALLEWFASRPTLPFELDIVRGRLNRSSLLDFNAEKEEVAAAIHFLEGEKYLARKIHALGSSPFYQVTSAGVLAFERGTLNS